MQSINDRRAMPRTPTAIRVQLRDRSGWMVAHDVSIGGMMVTTRAPRWPGELIRVRFSLPGEPRAICATCRVVDLVEVPRGLGLALQFVRLNFTAQLQLHSYIDRREVEPEDDSASGKVRGWMRRIIEDCAELRALARP